MGVYSNLVELITGDGKQAEASRSAVRVPMLADCLGYRAFDEDKQLFYQRDSKGFVLEISPLTGSNDRTADIIASIFSDVLLPGSMFSVTSYASPRIAPALQEWARERIARGGVFATLARHRMEKLRVGAWRSLASDGPFVLRHFRCFLSVSARDGGAVKIADLVAMREAIESAFDSIGISASRYSPVHLIRFFDEILAPTTGAGDHPPEYNRFEPINVQCVRHDIITRLQENRVILKAPSLRATGEVSGGVPEIAHYTPEEFDVRTMSVRNFPDRWTSGDTQRVIGDIFNPKLALPCPTLQTICGVMPGADASESKAGFKFARTTSLADGKASRLVPTLRKSSAEWEFVQEQVKAGEKLIRAYYAVTQLAPMGEGERCSRSLKALYKAGGWDLVDESYIQMHGFLAHFPMLLADGLERDLERMKRFKTLRSYNVAAMAPIQGEFVGGDIPHLLFIGRRGQPQFWSPFQNKAGNHNVSIAGKSGSGKSVLLQDLTASLAGVGAKTIVIDDGRSFEHMAKALGGTFTEFKLSSGISINPFRIIDPELASEDEDYLVDCMAMLKSIIAQMARHEMRLNDTERGLIDQAVNDVWSEFGSDATVDHIGEALMRSGHPFAQDLATSLLPFTTNGTYGKFFVGENNLDLSRDLTVFELSDLSGREELRGVVLTSIMFFASQTMRRMDRSIPKALMIDEAWQMLKGGAMADFVETYSRTCRKYGASLITATQSVHDYYKSEGSRAALENSDWSLILEQKPETIADFQKSGRFEMSSYSEALLRSLKRHGVDYSDIFVRGPECETVGRLVLDPYSATLYSSSPNVFANIEEHVAGGMTMAEAIEAVAFPELNQMREAAE